jgi:hypothetical protein
MHQLLNGQMFVGHPLNRLYWTFLYVAMAVCVIYYRFGIPLWRSLQLNLVVDKVVVEGPGVCFQGEGRGGLKAWRPWWQ